MVEKVDSYSRHIHEVSNMLNSFVKSKRIVAEEMTVIDALINTSFKDQVAVLNDNLLTIENQRILFGAMRNIRNTTLNMKESLKTAGIKKENPTTAEVCLEIIPYIRTLGQALDDFVSNFKRIAIKHRNELLGKIKEFSRILRKKAIQFDFSHRVIEKQELNVDESEMKKFIDEFNNELKLNIGIDEAPLDEGDD